MARKKKLTQAEEIAQAEQAHNEELAAQWIEEVTDAIAGIAEQLDAVIATVNQNAQEGNKLHETVTELCKDVNGINDRIEGLRAFEVYQRSVNTVNADRRQSLAERLRVLEDAVYVKEPTLWERIKARFSADWA